MKEEVVRLRLGWRLCGTRVVDRARVWARGDVKGD